MNKDSNSLRGPPIRSNCKATAARIERKRKGIPVESFWAAFVQFWAALGRLLGGSCVALGRLRAVRIGLGAVLERS